MGYKHKHAKDAKNFIEQIATERMYRLFELAREEFAKHPERSKRYVQLARKIGTRNRVKIPNELKGNYCKKCNAYLYEGKNMKVRFEGTMRRITCMECGSTHKQGVKK